MPSAPQPQAPAAAAGSGECAVLHTLLCTLAGRLLLHFPGSAFLRALAGEVLDPVPEDPQRQAAELAALAEATLALLEQPQRRTDPVARLMVEFGLSPFELDLLMLAAAPELDERFGDLFAGLNAGLRRLRVYQAIPLLVAESTPRQLIRSKLADSRLWRWHLLAEEEAAPVFERRLQTTPALADHIGGRSPLASLDAQLRRPAEEPSARAARELLPSLAGQARELACWAASAERAVICLVARDQEEAARCADALALGLSRPWLGTGVAMEQAGERLPQLAAAARLCGALPVLQLEDQGAATSLRLQARQLAALRGPLLVTAARPVDMLGVAALPMRRWIARPPRPLELVALWQHCLTAVAGSAEVDLLANQNHLGPERIQAAVDLARARALSAGRDAPVHQDVVDALRESLPDPVSRLASCERPQVPWEALVLERKPKAQLEALVQRLRHRIEVQERWELAAPRLGGRGKGLVALLHGESGTGKTFAAQAVASRVGLPMLAVDLSRVVSKYIGETEKHLNELFDLGEGFKALLFFDEADALFGKRTSVKDAHDRYANIEVNFLLQRLESFEGLVLLASNFQQGMDDAFTRRIGFSVFFPRPTPGQRLALWRQHLPGGRLAEDLCLDKVAERFDLVGGEIRNCALAAAYAAAAGEGRITQAVLESEITAEFAKMGRTQPRGISSSVKLSTQEGRPCPT